MKLVRVIWFTFILEVMLLALIKPLINNYESVGILLVTIHIAFSTILLFAYKNSIGKILIVGFLCRIFIMLWDIYGRNIFTLPHSAGDSEGFKYSAILIASDINLLYTDIYGGMYSKLIGLIFYFIGPIPIVGHYINVLLGITTIFIIYKILLILDLKPKVINYTLILAALFPSSVLMSGIFLREMFITFFATLSLYYFIKYFKKKSYSALLFSIVFLLMGASFHSGIIGILIGYSCVFIFYKHDRKKFVLSIESMIVFSVLVVLSYFTYTQFQDILFVKFSDIESVDAFYDTTNIRNGGSAYLSNISIDNPIEIIFYGPIKAFYFLSSPLPMDWRGIADIFTFFTDSILYLITIFYLVINRKYVRSNKALLISLIIVLFEVSLIFGLGVSNAGTAMRHRQKIIAICLVLLAIVVDSKQKKTSIKNHELKYRKII